MKLNVSTVLFVVVAMFFANFALAEGNPEFDGGYIKTQKGMYVEMKEIKASVTQITRAGMSISAVFSLPKNYYVVDKEGMISISSSGFKGVAIKGQHEFKNFSFASTCH
jgi:hypothetical protein